MLYFLGDRLGPRSSSVAKVSEISRHNIGRCVGPLYSNPQEKIKRALGTEYPMRLFLFMSFTQCYVLGDPISSIQRELSMEVHSLDSVLDQG